MDNGENAEVFLMITASVVIGFNWGLSRIFARASNLNLAADLRALWPESTYFLKAQSITLTVCTVGMAYSMYATGVVESVPATNVGMVALLAKASQVLIPVLKLFYITQLGSKNNPKLVASIGVFTVFQFGIANGLREIAAILAASLFVVPGLIVWFRSSLFMPIYALKGHDVGKAWRESWSLTRNKYWQVSRYLSPILFSSVIALGAVGLVEKLFSAVVERAHHEPGGLPFYFTPIAAAVSLVCAILAIALDLMYTGLLYKLYTRLSEQSNPTS